MLSSEMDEAGIPWAATDLAGDYLHLSDAFETTFSLDLRLANEIPFNQLWGISKVGVIHRINDSMMRTGRPQLVTARITPLYRQEEGVRSICWLERNGPRLVRISAFVSHAKVASTLNFDAIDRLVGQKILAA